MSSGHKNQFKYWAMNPSPGTSPSVAQPESRQEPSSQGFTATSTQQGKSDQRWKLASLPLLKSYLQGSWSSPIAWSKLLNPSVVRFHLYIGLKIIVPTWWDEKGNNDQNTWKSAWHKSTQKELSGSCCYFQTYPCVQIYLKSPLGSLSLSF